MVSFSLIQVLSLILLLHLQALTDVSCDVPGQCSSLPQGCQHYHTALSEIGTGDSHEFHFFYPPLQGTHAADAGLSSFQCHRCTYVVCFSACYTCGVCHDLIDSLQVYEVLIIFEFCGSNPPFG